jgi:hypothetical protein
MEDSFDRFYKAHELRNEVVEELILIRYAKVVQNGGK